MLIFCIVVICPNRYPLRIFKGFSYLIYQFKVDKYKEPSLHYFKLQQLEVYLYYVLLEMQTLLCFKLGLEVRVLDCKNQIKYS